jgi:hypothetical protein
MAHPMQEHRQHKVEHSRVSALTKGYASGGGVHSDEAEDRKMVKGMVKPGALKIAGKKAGGRLDRYARGGSVKKTKGSTHVNVIVAPQHGGAGAPMMPAGGGAMPMPPVMPPHPPMMPPGAGAPPGGMPSGLPQGMPPGMALGPHSRGGRTFAKGGKVADGAAWKEGLRNGTHVQHTDGKNDQSGLGRGKPITYAKGGPVEAFGMGPAMRAGAGVEQGREQKIALQKRSKRP